MVSLKLTLREVVKYKELWNQFISEKFKELVHIKKIIKKENESLIIATLYKNV